MSCIREADVGGPHRDAETGQGMWGHGGKGRSTDGELSEKACLPVMCLAREGDSPEASGGIARVPAPDSYMICRTEGVAPGLKTHGGYVSTRVRMQGRDARACAYKYCIFERVAIWRVVVELFTTRAGRPVASPSPPG